MTSGAAVRVGLYGGVSLFLYVVLLGVTPGLSTAEPTFAGELFPWVASRAKESLGQDHPASASRLTLILLALYCLYGFVLRELAARQSTALTRIVFVAGAAFLAVQIFGSAMYSADPFAYALYGRVLLVYDGDPYSDVADIDPGDPFLPLWTPGYLASRYGPLWTLISVGVAAIAGDHVGLTILLYRALAIAAALAAGVLIYSCLGRLAPARAAAGAAFFLWNPLVVLESGSSAHNDVLMAAFLMLAFWLVLRGRSELSMVPLVLSVLVKLVTAAAVPLFLVCALRSLKSWRERGVFLARSAALPLVVLVAVGVTYPGSITSVVGAGTSSSSYTNSLHELAFERLRVVLGDEPEMARVPAYFIGWWLKSTRTTQLRARDGGEGAVVETAGPDVVFLVRAPQNTDWAYVTDTTTHVSGYLNTLDAVETERPDIVGTDPLLARLEKGPEASPAVAGANLILRVGGVLSFAGVWLFALWRSRTPRDLAVSVTAVFLGAYWLVLGWFWPWYLIWALAPAALATDGRSARLAALLSATVLSLYVLTGAGEWAYHYRALPAFVLPLLLFPLFDVPRLMLHRGGGASIPAGEA